MGEIPNSGAIEQMTSPERFTGAPTEVPFKGIEYLIPDVSKDSWRPGIVDSNGGLVAAHDPERPVIHIAPQGEVHRFKGYEHGSATVPLTGGDQEGWPGGKYARDVVEMGINAHCRERGVKGRTVDAGNGYTMFTANPFDKGEFLDMTGVVEITDDGAEKRRFTLIDEMSSAAAEHSATLEQVGTFNVQNGVLAWITPEGRTQISPVEDDMLERLAELGYTQSDMDVPHSNGEAFAARQASNPTQAFGELMLAVMERKGETMTMEQRNSPEWRSVIIPTKFLDRVTH